MQWPRWSELVLGIVAIVAALLVGLGIGKAGTSPASGRLRVSASGTAKVAPDEASVTLGANVLRPTASAALAALSVISNRLVADTVSYGILPKDIQTSNLSESQSYGNNGRPNGYQASETFTLTVHRMSELGAIVAAATDHGANQVNGINFSTSDPNAGMQQAIAQAIQAAHRQAEAEARELGVQLGSVVSVQVGQSSSQPPIYYGYAMASAKSAQAGPAIAPGNQTVNAEVTVTYAFR